ncbi:MAG: type II and III secretion system protein family protein [Planctomycetota bacterium]|jgi:pilus assembly protein CpaC
MKSAVERAKAGRYGAAFIALVILVCTLLPVHSAQANSEDFSAKPEAITFLVGESTIVRSPWPTVRVAVTDPAIANVQVLTPEQVLLQGLKVGTTDLIVWSEDERQVQQWKVQVRLDTASVKAKLDELFSDCTLEVNQSGEALIVTGLLRSTEQVAQLHDLLDKSGTTYVDMSSVAGVQQVLLQVRVAEVSRVALRALGFNAFHTDDDWFWGLRSGSSSGPLVSSIDIGVPSGTVAGDVTSFEFNQNVAASPAVSLFAGFPKADFEFFLQALAENQALRILANPTLVALSGEQASFLAGGEFPIPVVQSGTGGAGGNAVTIEYREYGVRVSFRPVVLGDGTIRLTAAPEVSDLSDAGAVTVQGFRVPALVTRKAETTLELASGQTFAMAGLLQHKNEAINSRVPGLGDLPVLGPLFRSVRYQKNETELVVLVTATLVEPMSLAAVPPVPGFTHAEPNDWEFYIDGRIEGKEPAKINAEDAHWLRQMGLDQLAGPGAWDSYNRPSSSSPANPAAQSTDTQKAKTEERRF